MVAVKRKPPSQDATKKEYDEPVKVKKAKKVKAKK